MRRGMFFVVLTVLGAPLAAQVDYATSPEGLMQRFDANGDGRVHEGEYLAYLGRGFAVRDGNGDGVLNGAELPPGSAPLHRETHTARLQRQFQRQDRNGDGALSAAELMAPPPG